MSVEVTYSIVCDQCGRKVSGFRKSPSLAPHKAYTMAWNQCKDEKWQKRDCGSKGTRHYCWDCLTSTPELSTWHMAKILNHQ